MSFARLAGIGALLVGAALLVLLVLALLGVVDPLGGLDHALD
jgi:hypothetical protein